MPSRPPETPFYEVGTRATAWRDITRMIEDFEEGPGVFFRIVTDIQLRVEPMSCHRCKDGSMENLATAAQGVQLKCPKCGWQPITVEQGIAV